MTVSYNLKLKRYHLVDELIVPPGISAEAAAPQPGERVPDAGGDPVVLLQPDVLRGYI